MEGFPYPALYRLQGRGLVESERLISEKRKRAKYYLRGLRRIRVFTTVAAMTLALAGAGFPLPSPSSAGLSAGGSRYFLAGGRAEPSAVIGAGEPRPRSFGASGRCSAGSPRTDPGMVGFARRVAPVPPVTPVGRNDPPARRSP
jgi:hypothetical protein